MKGRRRAVVSAAMWLLAGVASACTEADPEIADGFETGACLDGQCLGGLECISNVCVAPDDATTSVVTTGDPDPSTSGVSATTDPNPTDPTNPTDPATTSTGVDDSTGPSVDDSTGPGTTDGGPACASTHDGVCDEPEGTGLCPEGTDEEDCAEPACTGDPAVFPPNCDQWIQNCPDGEKCMPYSSSGGLDWDDLGCFPVDCSPADIGDPCEVVGSGVSGIDNCGPGAMCWNVDDTNIGYCVAMCEGSPVAPTCSDPSSTCAIANDGVISLCLPECQPLMSTCADGEICAPINDTFACAPDASGATGAFGDSCQFINACDPGLACLGPDSFSSCGSLVGCCTTFCDVSDPFADAACAAADPAQTCEAWFTAGAAPLGYENVGICSVAA